MAGDSSILSVPGRRERERKYLILTLIEFKENVCKVYDMNSQRVIIYDSLLGIYNLVTCLGARGMFSEVFVHFKK